MKKQLVYDERVSAEKRKIGSDACSILMMVLLASILVQQYGYNAPFAQYAVEFICFVGASVYILVRNFLSGNNLFSEKKSFAVMVVVNSAVASLAVTTINGLFRYMQYGEHAREHAGLFAISLALTFVCSFAVTFAVLFFVYRLNQKKQAQIEKSLGDDDNLD